MSQQVCRSRRESNPNARQAHGPRRKPALGPGIHDGRPVGEMREKPVKFIDVAACPWTQQVLNATHRTERTAEPKPRHQTLTNQHFPVCRTQLQPRPGAASSAQIAVASVTVPCCDRWWKVDSASLASPTSPATSPCLESAIAGDCMDVVVSREASEAVRR